jgi:hypothetical protein
LLQPLSIAAVALVGCVTWASGVAAQEAQAPPKIVAFIEKCERAVPESIKAVEQQIKLTDSTNHVKASPKERKEAKEKLKAMVAELKEGKTLPVLRIPLSEARVGDIGFMTNGNPNQPATVRVLQVIDENSLLAKHGGRVFWLKTPTGHLVDDDALFLNEVLEVAGTETYNTRAGGSNTVYRLERFDIDTAKQWFVKLRQH